MIKESENKTNTASSLGGSQVGSRLSFREAFSRAAKQTGLIYCPKETAELYRELCFVIAEVYILREESKIKIGDELIDAYLVQEIFAELKYAHLELVVNNICAIQHKVNNMRAYIRTALYNAVFEIESHYINAVRADGIV